MGENRENKKPSESGNQRTADDLREEVLENISGGTGPTCGICNKPLYECTCNTTNAL